MRTMMRSLVVCFLMIIVILLSPSRVHAQDLSTYRDFSFGMTVADLSKQIDQKPANAAVLHERPALIQELTWWPPQPDRKSTRLNSSHSQISYAVFCLKKKKQ